MVVRVYTGGGRVANGGGVVMVEAPRQSDGFQAGSSSARAAMQRAQESRGMVCPAGARWAQDIGRHDHAPAAITQPVRVVAG